MHNAFLVIRTVFFALLTYFHVLILVFASWNIVAAKSSGTSAPGASLFLLTSSLCIFVLVPVAYLAEFICARARPAHVRVECTWTALMSIFQLAASIDVTVNGPPVYCQTLSPWGMCASSSLLVHISWLATLIILSYCLTICVASATHATSLPDIWITPVPHVPWLHPGAEPPAPAGTSQQRSHKHAKTLSSASSWSETCAISKYIAERWEKLSHVERQPVVAPGPAVFIKGRQSIDPTRPTWARQQRTRRGIDSPFAVPLPRRIEPPVLLAPPPRTHSEQVMGANCFRPSGDGEQQRKTTSTYSYSTLSAVFPHRLSNQDLPIPRPGLSEWVRADALVEKTVGT